MIELGKASGWLGIGAFPNVRVSSTLSGIAAKEPFVDQEGGPLNRLLVIPLILDF